MTRQYTSSNFYWYSNDERSQWLPYIAVLLEGSFQEVADILGVTLSRMVSVFYYTPHDISILEPTVFPPVESLEEGGGGGGMARYRIYITRALGSTTVDDSLLGLLIHEFVHVLQFTYLIDWPSMRRMELPLLDWIMEGTATYLDGGIDEGSGGRLMVSYNVRNNNIPTLDYLEDDFYAAGWINYAWGGTIAEFIAETFGMEYLIAINRVHGDYMGIFGITRAEFERQWHQWLRDTFQ